jgi:hypothetical protein
MIAAAGVIEFKRMGSYAVHEGRIAGVERLRRAPRGYVTTAALAHHRAGTAGFHRRRAAKRCAEGIEDMALRLVHERCGKRFGRGICNKRSQTQR